MMQTKYQGKNARSIVKQLELLERYLFGEKIEQVAKNLKDLEQ